MNHTFRVKNVDWMMIKSIKNKFSAVTCLFVIFVASVYISLISCLLQIYVFLITEIEYLLQNFIQIYNNN